MEIKVGEWIRDKHGLILKYEYLNEYDNFAVDFGQKGKCRAFDDMEEFEDYVKNDIVTHSFNIIDLIQEGDYVNGEKVVGIFNPMMLSWGELPYVIAEIGNHYEPQEIKSIVTSEQFKSIEYVLEEK